jgi:hypothetical protein
MHVSVTGVSIVSFCVASAIVIPCAVKYFMTLLAESPENRDADLFSDPIPDEPEKQRPPELGIQLAESIHKYRMEHDEIR